MCTVTILPGAALRVLPPEPRPLLRLVFNRDELRSRREALPPTAREIAGHRVLMPIDADAGGTWVAVNDAGLVLAILNVTTRPAADGDAGTRAGDGSRARGPKGPRAQGLKDDDTGGNTGCGDGRESRGLIIPSLAGCARLPDVVTRLRVLDPQRHAPFRLMAISTDAVVDALSDGGDLRLRRQPLDRPRIRTSSSLGDALVTSPRTLLFGRLLAHAPVDARAQDAFHRHQWPARPHMSVLMSREDARTMSITTVEVHEAFVSMVYEPVADDASGPGVPRRIQQVIPRPGRESPPGPPASTGQQS